MPKYLGMITVFRRDRNTRGGGVFICVKNALHAWNRGRTRILRR
jgi:hypothetical protein